MRYGKWNMILATNMLVLVSIGICMINDQVSIMIGRFLYGMACGAFTVYIPKFVAEYSPAEYRGPFGAVNQFMCTLGIVVCSLMALPVPSKQTALNEVDPDSFIVTQYWRVVWGLPALFVLLQVTLMLTVFRFDTPVSYKQRADYDNLSQLLAKMYV
jgi:MFS family permease